MNMHNQDIYGIYVNYYRIINNIDKDLCNFANINIHFGKQSKSEKTA